MKLLLAFAVMACAMAAIALFQSNNSQEDKPGNNHELHHSGNHDPAGATPIQREPSIDQGAENQEIPSGQGSSMEECLSSTATWDCIFQFDLSTVSPEEAADLLNRSDLSHQSKASYLCAIMLAMDITEVAVFLDTTAQLMNEKPERVFDVFQSAMSLMAMEKSFWVDSLLSTLVPQDIFSEDRTHLLVMMLNALPDRREAINSLLYEGSLGQWGGSTKQVLRAFDYCLYDFVKNDTSNTIGYIEDALTSPTVPYESGIRIVQHGLLYADILANKQNISIKEAEDILILALNHPQYQEAAAKQFVADFSDNQFAGFDEQMMAEYLELATRIVDR